MEKAPLQLPVFTYDINTWLMHLEASWTGSTNITDLHKFQAVVRAIPADVAARIAPVLRTPPEDGKYEAVKTALVNALGKSSEAYIVELDSLQYDGGRPSVFLSRLQNLNWAAGSPLSDEILRYRHTSLMPPYVRQQLATLRGPITLQEYAEIVDKVHATYTWTQPPPPSHLAYAYNTVGGFNAPAFSAFSNPSAFYTPSAPSAFNTHSALNAPSATTLHHTRFLNAVERPEALTHSSSMDARLAEMTKAIQRLEAAMSDRHTPAQRRYCFYHDTFGAAARKCHPPCDFSGNGRRGGW